MLKNTTSAFKISIIYLIFSLLWIYFSDNAINLIIDNSEQLKFLQTIKGLLFVTFTSLLLYLLSKQLFNNLQKEKEKLTNTNYILEKIIENAPIIIFWKDRSGTYKGYNNQFLELMNIKNKDELIGKRDSDFNINEKEDFMNDDVLVMSSKKPKLNYIETITTQDSNIKTLNTSKVPLIDEKGNVIGVLGVINDITEELKSKKQIALHNS